MIDFFTYLGNYFSWAFIVIWWTILLTCVTIHWHCGICGKPNSTGLLKFVFRMCDHGMDKML